MHDYGIKKYDSNLEFVQTSLFDTANNNHIESMENNQKHEEINFCKTDFNNYTIEKYIKDVNTYGLESLWTSILEYALTNTTSLLTVSNFGMLYEMGLAEQDKSSKKNSGQYFTPDDVSILMSNWFKRLKGENICDVGCGTGNLILAYLNEVGKNETERLLKEKKIYLYDFDKTALKIAQYSIAITYGIQHLNNINTIYGDFLDKNIKLPENSKVITNPPYAKITVIQPTWLKTDNLLKSKDLYSAFIEKIVKSGSQAVIISPYSFLGSNKFYPLRQVLNNYNGFIVAFDNVPGNIFNGRKLGVFNTNTSNSVRVAITVVENNSGDNGFRVSHLIRFKTEERQKLLQNSYLETLPSKKRQIVSPKRPAYIKCHKELENAFSQWNAESDKTLSDLLSKTETEYLLYMPNTCRYFTTASVKKLKRTGLITLWAKDEESFDLVYSMINSSFAYWWWRIFDGGITYPIGLLNKLPIFEKVLTNDDRQLLKNMRIEMSSKESKHLVTKLNAGVEQENIKFPPKYRDKLNKLLFRIMGCADDYKLLNLVHSNSTFSTKEEE